MKIKVGLVWAILHLAISIPAQNLWTLYQINQWIYCTSIEDDKIWIGTNGGIICKDLAGTTIKVYTTADGLAGNNIYDIAIDNQGKKWIGTSAGLSVFDGINWITYNTANSGLPCNWVNSIVIDDEGTKWIGTNIGLGKFDGNNWTAYTTDNSGLLNNYINCVTIDSIGNLWLGTKGGVCKYDGNEWITYNKFNSDITDNIINTITIDELGNKWIGTSTGGIFKYNDTTWISYNATNSGIPSNYIMTSKLDDHGNLWFGTTGGFTEFNGSSWVTFNKSNSGLTHNQVHSIDFDFEGNSWIGTVNGLNKFSEEERIDFLTLITGLPSNSIYDVFVDQQGNKWFGTNEGVCKFDGNNWTTYKTNNSGLANNIVWAIATDDIGNVWFGTKGGGVSKFNGINWKTYTTANSGLSNDIIRSITIDNEGNIWFGTSGSGACKFDGINWTTYNTSNSGLPYDYVNDIVVDIQGNTWFATGSGVTKFDGVHWKTYTKSNSGLTYGGILEMAIDGYGNKWFATGGGVFKFDDICWIKYDSVNSGLADNYTFTIDIDSQGNKWIGTAGKGMNKFNDIDWITYDVDNSGLIHQGVNDIAIDQDGNKWMGTTYGVNKFKDGGSGPLDLRQYKPIYGIVFNDINSNGLKEPDEPLLPSRLLRVINDSTFATTQDNGKFCITRKTGIYKIELIADKYWQFTTDSIQIAEILDTTSQVTGIDFGIKMIENINDVTIDLTGGIPRAGFESRYWVNYKNKGTQPKDGVITLDIDSLVNIISTTPAPTSQNGNRLTWNFSNLVSLEERNIYIGVKMPDISHQNDTLETTAVINPIFGDTIPTDNTSILHQVVIGSFDPNDKAVNEEPGNSGSSLSDHELSYTIRFQNIGTDTAFNVIIRDTIDQSLNLETFRLISSSHNVKVDIKEKNIITFIYNNINLPDDKTNLPESCGFVKYSLKPYKNLKDSTEITNKGYIFFDFNPPVVTNEVKTTYIEAIQNPLLVSTKTLYIDATDNCTSHFNIYSCLNWTIHSDNDWVTVSDSIGSDNETVFITASTNPFALSRCATITVSSGEAPDIIIIITQKAAPAYLSVTPGSLNISSAVGSTSLIELNSNTNWNVTCDQPWLNISDASGVNNQTITLTAEENPTIETRTATITISGTGVSDLNIIVTQDASLPYLSLSTNTINIDAEDNSTATFDINSNISWILNCDQPWLSINNASGVNNNTITLTAEANPNDYQREATITISGNNLPDQSIIVNQTGCFTDIIDIKQEQLKIFPNPAMNYIFLENLAKNEAKYLLTLKNIHGQDIHIKQINFLNKFELDVSTLAEGIYYLILQNENEQIVYKIIKIK